MKTSLLKSDCKPSSVGWANCSPTSQNVVTMTHQLIYDLSADRCDTSASADTSPVSCSDDRGEDGPVSYDLLSWDGCLMNSLMLEID